jgi:hypothetical protein
MPAASRTSKAHAASRSWHARAKSDAMSQAREGRAFALWRAEGRTGEDEGRLLGDRAVAVRGGEG